MIVANWQTYPYRKLKQPNYQSIWKQIVQIKCCNPSVVKYPIWSSICQLIDICNIGCNMIVGNGMNTLFSRDR
jgi:hypothetical protein